MVSISLNKEDVPKLYTSGVAVTINGSSQILKRDGDYLTYDKNRCKVLSASSEGRLCSFICASKSDESEPHVIIGPNGGVETIN